jgi:uncharacterized membrane protein HdeD (DUF308 family)
MELNETFVALGVPLGAFFMAVAIVAVVGYFRNQEQQRRAELIKLALEKGQPLPPALLEAPRFPGSDLARGIKTIFVGLGLGVFLWMLKPDRSIWAVGLLVGFIGVGQLVAHAVTRNKDASPTAP